jgi:hypothetical protein
MAGFAKSDLRGLVPQILREKGFEEIRPKTGRGLLPGSRLTGVKDGAEVIIAAKASAARTLNFTKQSKGTWRTASAVDIVVAVVPAASGAGIEAYCFDSKKLTKHFNRAWQALEKAGRSLSFAIPIFVPIDDATSKDLGHSIGNLGLLAEWSVTLTAEQVRARTETSRDDFYTGIRRQIAEHNNVDISQIELEFRIKAK